MIKKLVSENWVPWVTTGPGKCILWAFFSAALILSCGMFGLPAYYSLLASLVIAATTLFPTYRHHILMSSIVFGILPEAQPGHVQFGMKLILGKYPFLQNYHPTVVCAVGFLAATGICVIYRSLISELDPRHFLRRHSWALFLLLYLACVFGASMRSGLMVKGAVWLVLISIAPMIPFLGYDLQSLKGPNTPVPPTFYRPFWIIFSSSPMPKGIEYMRQIEAKNAIDLGRIQLHGLRLLLWTIVLQFVRLGVEELLFENPDHRLTWLNSFRVNLPTGKTILQGLSRGQSFDWSTLWLSAYADFFSQMLYIAIIVNIGVSIARMAGFYARRNTYRPFESRSLIEFFNRYNYYFKDFLLNMFFIPVFARFFRGHLRMRMAFAIFCSVGLGNFIFHFIRDVRILNKMGLSNGLAYFQPYMVYCLILSGSLVVTQLNTFNKPLTHTKVGWFRRVIKIFFIVTFFTLLTTFDERFNGDIVNNWRWFLSLVGQHGAADP